MNNNIYPWQNPQWLSLYQAKQSSRLPHAILFTGIAGIGKQHFAECFIRHCLCSQNQKKCDCHTCRLLEGKVHPNVLWIEAEENTIKIDKIRKAEEFLNQSALQGDFQFVLINPAHTMNIHAANALLKTLEEPAANAVIILISDQSERLQPTILSRCQRLNFQRPTKEEALKWLRDEKKDLVQPELILNLAQGAPLAALRLAEDERLLLRKDLLQHLFLLHEKKSDPLKLAAKWQDEDLIMLIDFCLSWIVDLMRLQLGGDPEKIINCDFQTELTALEKRLPLNINLQWMDDLQQVRKNLLMGINLNKQLVLENIFIRWMQLSVSAI